ncbi:MAG: GIY-YIG nuclease family protein [Beijerinckiaceae bacterium]
MNSSPHSGEDSERLEREVEFRCIESQNRRMERVYYVYLLTSRRNGTLCCGVTNNIRRRVQEHKSRSGSSFTTRYDVMTLVWYEAYADVNTAIAREKQIKHWNRAWKLALIERVNPNWRDLYEELNA